jgi:hypothetical protein
MLNCNATEDVRGSTYGPRASNLSYSIINQAQITVLITRDSGAPLSHIISIFCSQTSAASPFYLNTDLVLLGPHLFTSTPAL